MFGGRALTLGLYCRMERFSFALWVQTDYRARTLLWHKHSIQDWINIKENTWLFLLWLTHVFWLFFSDVKSSTLGHVSVCFGSGGGHISVIHCFKRDRDESSDLPGLWEARAAALHSLSYLVASGQCFLFSLLRTHIIRRSPWEEGFKVHVHWHTRTSSFFLHEEHFVIPQFRASSAFSRVNSPACWRYGFSLLLLASFVLSGGSHIQRWTVHIYSRFSFSLTNETES